MTTAKAPQLEQALTLPYRLVLDFRALNMTGEQFLQLCSDNSELRMELSSTQELIIMPPGGLERGRQETEAARQVSNWAIQDGNGLAFGSNAGYTLPNGAIRAPDVSWMPLARWEALDSEEQRRFGHTFPDFVIELRSPSDRLSDVQAKMEEYLENGARLGWLLDPDTKLVHIYRPGHQVEVLEAPESVSGGQVLQGFVLDLTRIW